MKFFHRFIISVLCIINIKSCTGNFVEIEIPQGQLKGIAKQSWQKKDFTSFIGIPYAEPPVGNLRFEAPVPLKEWEGLLDATQYKSDCIQNNVFVNNFDVTGSEDCLYINVYTPSLPLKSGDALPVMFFTHGGGWSSGSSSAEYYGPEFFMGEGIVLVTFNYRLGALGFLSTGDEVVPGNNGLKDQSLALKWTKENIQYFGGDPNKITLFGNSAGGGSVHYQIFSPLTRDLINGAIIQSGTALAPWSLGSKQYAENNKNRLGELLNCPLSSNKDLVNCLKTRSASEIITNTLKLYNWNIYDPVVPFRPVIEPYSNGAFLVEKPEEAAKSEKVSNIPIILSITQDEGYFRVGHIYKNSMEHEFNNNFGRLAPDVLLYSENPNKDRITKSIRKFYFGDKPIDRNTATELINAITDSWFLYPLSKAVGTHNKYTEKPVYAFLFDYRGLRSNGESFDNPSFKKFVSHSDELLYLFTARQYGIYHNSDIEIKAVKNMMKLWTNFAKFGNPTPVEEKDLPEWEPAKGKQFKFYYMNKNADLQMIDNPFSDRIQFWKNICDPVSKNEL